MPRESTSSEVASIAARGIKAPHTLTLDEVRAVCASALTQREREPLMARIKRALGR